jgi:hypothetical protein
MPLFVPPIKSCRPGRGLTYPHCPETPETSREDLLAERAADLQYQAP